MSPKALIYGLFMFCGQQWRMNIVAAVKSLNERAAREKWYHICDPTLAFKDPLHERFLALWKSKAGSRPMPTRSDMTLRDLKDFLKDIVIWQRDGPSRYSWRLVGTKAGEVVGHQTGKSFEESIPPEHLPRWIGCGDLILDGGRPMRFVGRVHLQGKEYLTAENLLVPLANDSGEPTFIMGLCRYSPRSSEAEESWESQIASIPAAFL
jgi:hypothetical protein